jgi:hypothetical protein
VLKDVNPPSTTANATAADSGSTMGTQKKSLGPLIIHNVGLQVKDSHVFILIDADVLLGVLRRFWHWTSSQQDHTPPLSLQLEDFQLVLSGLGVLYNAPPILIAGGFKHEDTDTYEGYMGGLMISTPPYSITAVGAYRQTKPPNDFKSVFLFGRLDGPLLMLEFAEISGVTVSFGYNYNLRTPRGPILRTSPCSPREAPA